MLNEKLQKELLEMKANDLNTRQKLVESGELFSQDQDYHPTMKKVHMANNQRIKDILDQVGWPGFSLVGDEGCEAAWLIVQHAVLEPELQITALTLLEKAVENNDADPKMMAFLKDRILMQLGKPQVYGTQHVLDKKSNRLVPYTIESPTDVERLRENIGLEPLKSKTESLNTERDTSLNIKRP